MNRLALLAVVAAVALTGACSKKVSIQTSTPVVASKPPPPREPEPEPEPARVEVKKDRIEVTESIYFDTNQATIRAESFGLLDEIARVINEHAEIKKLRIEGHTDSVGGASYNLTLSKKRAAAVSKYLVSKGVSAARLSSEGYGLTKPVADNDSEDGRAKNRRVAFTILERADEVAATDAR